jgi:hypothetical protein
VYELLGETYIHGICEGEALRGSEDPGQDSGWTRVVLR